MKPTVEQLIAKLTCYEDLDTALHIKSRDADGGVVVHDFEWDKWAESDTLQDALLDLLNQRSDGR